MEKSLYQVHATINTSLGQFSGVIDGLIGTYDEVEGAMMLIVKNFDSLESLQLYNRDKKHAFGKGILQQSVISYSIIEEE